MRIGRMWSAGFLVGLLVLSFPASSPATELVGGYWPSDAADERLKEADGKLLELQRRRFRALFGSDKAEAERLNKEFGKLQRERRELLRASGRR